MVFPDLYLVFLFFDRVSLSYTRLHLILPGFTGFSMVPDL